MSNRFSRRDMLRLGAITGLNSIALGLPALSTRSVSAQTVSLAQGIVQAATQFLASLDANALSKASYSFTDQERFRWHWTTPSGFPRNGLPLKDMNDQQRELALALLRTSISEAGYKKALDIMSLQKDLGNDPLLYYVTVFGTVGDAKGWGWRFEGHHLSRQFTLVGEKVAVTPFFLGAWPTISGAKLRAMPREEDAARELARSLDGASQAAGIFQRATLTNHVTQNMARVEPLEPVGVLFSDLTSDQQARVMEIIQTYLGVLPDSLMKDHLDRINKAGLDKIRFGWAGSLDQRRPYYYRLQGPTFLLEHDNSRNGGTHIHSVWRNFNEDFGYDLL
ncbi:MAG: DUF3500 domain-containing protein [Anaerolineae bacterium]|nr:DUF3500 domain-containing protein [Anaerolineae bacterium]